MSNALCKLRISTASRTSSFARNLCRRCSGASPSDWQVHYTLQHPGQIIGVSAALLVLSLVLIPFLGREFLPPFNEGTLAFHSSLPPGTSLAESKRVGQLIEETLHTVPEVVSTTRRTGRAEGDEHAAGVNINEIEVVTKPSKRPHTAVMDEVRRKLANIPGLDSEVGQPISHRIDHLLSGTRAQLAMVGLRAGEMAHNIETALNGHVASQVMEEQKVFDVIVRLDDSARASLSSLGRTLIDRRHLHFYIFEYGGDPGALSDIRTRQNARKSHGSNRTWTNHRSCQSAHFDEVVGRVNREHP